MNKININLFVHSHYQVLLLSLLLVMLQTNHWAIFLSNSTNKNSFVQKILNGKGDGYLNVFNSLKGVLFSAISLNEFIEEEEKHEEWTVSKQYNRGIRNLSSGEQKKALLAYLLKQNPDFIILDNPFDNIDVQGQIALLENITALSSTISMIQLVNRNRDVLPFIKNALRLEDNNSISTIEKLGDYIETITRNNSANNSIRALPPPIKEFILESDELISFKNVMVSYEERVIVKNINWTINRGDFWQLIGPNGSGKTTLLTMINGDNPKAYNQNITLFGKRKGTGETVWEIKQKVGYLTPSMTDLFSTRHTVEEMIISGFLDSIGLYKLPSDRQVRLAEEWLDLIEMSHLKKAVFCSLSLGQQRLALVARAMVKHPPLLILDEAMSGLDDYNATIVTSLINKIAAESKTTILYVSHRIEEGLTPNKIFELTPSENGSTGTEQIVTNTQIN